MDDDFNEHSFIGVLEVLRIPDFTQKDVKCDKPLYIIGCSENKY